MNISGNTILITGGNAGIGRALAGALHREGNRIIITGRREAALKETVAAHPGMEWRVLDVADPAAITAFAAQIVREVPELNAVVHNAGIMIVEDLTAEPVDLAVPEAIIATNLLGPIRLTAALLPHLKRREAASILTVSSGLAFVPLVATPTYNATKAAIHSWSEALRAQLAQTSVDVIEIVPPGVATDLMPGHAQNPNSMPLDAFIAEVMALLKAHPHGPEICVERVGFLRGAEARGEYATVFARLNELF
ncbi:SDR family oxidoreductase [Ancylobacter radicis]|uniref:SDR family NAD(P)-dependent oxidoreductase n=1 Tax=Ancylobacter radicis TaxID=2836179 RepID=A0ABS5R3T8_9HYPH|nr:SDR family NAD(P)-dependent oxidoreductase [Ancylobacter radicis]MBS9475576.1 SDR family NAD(P)-dependent oxidoreductase [Ancylobacter radicis]